MNAWLQRTVFVFFWIAVMALGLTAWAVIYFWRYAVPLLVLYVVFRVARLRRRRGTLPRR